MTQPYTKASFWKCALQVNTFDYITYRGANHGLSEEQYNNELLRHALENDIKVIGLANHGNVDGVEAIQKLMRESDIVVFPGFEISTTEKVHFVCLFPENTTKDTLNRYLGALELTNPVKDTWPSTLGGEKLLEKVAELGGFAYAAHCIHDNGIIQKKLNHVWQNPLLLAAQIPSTLDELNGEDTTGHYRILSNKEPEYKREIPIAILNAKDVAIPEDLANPKASCLIKMTKPTFDSFKLAFQDPQSRVRLNSEVSEKYYSRIENIKITGGYLDGLNIEFSEHLNAVIGGRGAGKSTLLECIRYALEQKPIGVEAQRQHDAIINENLGKSKGRVELLIRSSRMNGKLYTISRRHGESATIKEDNNEISSFTPRDLLPNIEIFGQNEIYEITRNPENQRKVLKRFIDIAGDDIENRIQEIIIKLALNRKKITDALSETATIEDAVAKLPKLEESLKQFKSIEGKLGILPLLETEKRLKNRILEDEILQVERAFASVYEGLPDTVFLSDAAIEKLPHKDLLQKLKVRLDQIKKDAETLLEQWNSKFNIAKTEIEALTTELDVNIQKEEANLEKKFKELPSLEGKKGMEVGIEYQNLLKEIELIRPQKTAIDNKRN
ncbi:MAG: AAA family ATPase, partial [Leptospirales bacterium]